MEVWASEPGHTHRKRTTAWRQRELEDEEMDEYSERQWFIHAGRYAFHTHEALHLPQQSRKKDL